MPRGRLLSLPLLLLLAAAGAVVVERLVVTDAEALGQLLEDARDAVAERDFARLRPMLSDDFVWEGLGPDAALERVAGLVRRAQPTRIELDWDEPDLAGDQATVALLLRVWLLGGAYGGHARLRFAREAQGWRLTEARTLGP